MPPLAGFARLSSYIRAYQATHAQLYLKPLIIGKLMRIHWSTTAHRRPCCHCMEPCPNNTSRANPHSGPAGRPAGLPPLRPENLSAHMRVQAGSGPPGLTSWRSCTGLLTEKSFPLPCWAGAHATPSSSIPVSAGENLDIRVTLGNQHEQGHGVRPDYRSPGRRQADLGRPAPACSGWPAKVPPEAPATRPLPL